MVPLTDTSEEDDHDPSPVTDIHLEVDEDYDPTSVTLTDTLEVEEDDHGTSSVTDTRLEVDEVHNSTSVVTLTDTHLEVQTCTLYC